MLKKKIKIFILTLLSVVKINASEIEGVLFQEKKIEVKKVIVNSKIKGITQVYDEYDITAPFDGQIINIYPSLFDVVSSSSPLINIVSGEVSALLKTAKDEYERQEILKRWKGMFNYNIIKAPESGVVSRIYFKQNDYVNKGERILTISRKMRVIAKNTEKIYLPIEKGLGGIIETPTQRYSITLKDFIQEKEGFYQLFFDFDELCNIKVGEKVEGVLMIAKSENARVIPKDDIIEYNKRKYILIEFEPGIITDSEIEVSGFKFNYLKMETKRGSRK